MNPRFRRDFDALMSSGLYSALTGDALLVGHAMEREDEDGTLILVPEQVPFASYPYEWTGVWWSVYYRSRTWRVGQGSSLAAVACKRIPVELEA